MIWQEAVITAGQLAFVALLMPTLLNHASQVPRWTSIPTALILAAFAVAFGTLALAGAAATSTASATAWAFIAWRKPTRRPA